MKPDDQSPSSFAFGHRGPPIVYVRRVRCPNCNSLRIKVRSTINQGDDSLLRYSKCRDCGESFKVVAE